MATAETALLIEKLLTTDTSATVLITEADNKYLPFIESLTVALANGEPGRVTAIEPDIAQKVEETRQALKRQDRIMWALRFYKKALVYELLWICRNDPDFIAQKLGHPPAPQQPQLERQLQKMSDVDITPFQDNDPNDPEDIAPPYTGYATIDAINEWLGGYIEAAQEFTQGRFQDAGGVAAKVDAAFEEKFKRPPGTAEAEPFVFNGVSYTRREGKWWNRQFRENMILNLIFNRQSFGEIVSLFRREKVNLEKRFRRTLEVTPNPWKDEDDAGDLHDTEGPAKTIIKFPNGWRWIDLMRPKSLIRCNKSFKSEGGSKTEHCGNMFNNKPGQTVFELIEPMGSDRYRNHAFFVLEPDGMLGEMKGHGNYPPSPKHYKYIVDLLLKEKRIKGLRGTAQGAYGAQEAIAEAGDFKLKMLPKDTLDMLFTARPELLKNSSQVQLPDRSEMIAAMKARIEQRKREREAAQRQAQAAPAAPAAPAAQPAVAPPAEQPPEQV